MARISALNSEIESRLRKRYAELWGEVKGGLAKYDGQRFQDLVQGAGDPEDFATADLLIDLNLSEIDRDVAELRGVQNALARLKRGTYGVCESCGRDIDPARLEAVPYAARCLSCQESAERLRIDTPSL